MQKKSLIFKKILLSILYSYITAFIIGFIAWGLVPDIQCSILSRGCANPFFEISSWFLFGFPGNLIQSLIFIPYILPSFIYLIFKFNKKEKWKSIKKSYIFIPISILAVILLFSGILAFFHAPNDYSQAGIFSGVNYGLLHLWGASMFFIPFIIIYIIIGFLLLSFYLIKKYTSKK